MREADDSLLGRVIAGKFRLESILGSGAMGAVYKARQLTLDKVVAVKVLHRDLAADPMFVARFKREAKASSRLDHPNSIRVLDYGTDEELLFMALEFLDGRNLLQVLNEDRPLPPQRIVDIMVQILAALAVAHDLGIVHRDLKPENIMVLKGRSDDDQPVDLIKVCDFGIATITDARAYQTDADKGPLTRTGSIVGTPEYMSPEQGRGDKLDARSDVYAMGVILYHLLTGRTPFDAENAIGIILKHITEEPVRPSEVEPAADPGLEQVCLKAMRKKREDRHGSAREMRSELRAIQDQLRGAPAPARTSTKIQNARFASEAAMAVTAIDGQIAPSSPTTATNAEILFPAGVPRSRRGLFFGVAVTLGIPLAIGIGWRLKDRASADETTTRDAPSVSAPLPPAPQDVPLATIAPLPPVSPRPKNIRRAHPSATVPIPIASAPVTPPPPAASAPVMPSVAPSGPPYDPSQAFVEIGFVNASRVAENAVSAALKQARLTGCYQTALRAKGVGAGGTSTLNLSIDETGGVRSAVLTGNDFLPGATACVQTAAAAIHLRPKAVEEGSGGATAEIMLVFHP